MVRKLSHKLKTKKHLARRTKTCKRSRHQKGGSGTPVRRRVAMKRRSIAPKSSGNSGMASGASGSSGSSGASGFDSSDNRASDESLTGLELYTNDAPVAASTASTEGYMSMSMDQGYEDPAQFEKSAKAHYKAKMNNLNAANDKLLSSMGVVEAEIKTRQADINAKISNGYKDLENAKKRYKELESQRADIAKLLEQYKQYSQ
jgi:hypothetical protein